MSSASYAARALVLRKTKLGESDLVITFLASDGSQLRAVARGARKPTSTFASRLELYAVVDLLCLSGKNLDIVKEARLVAANDKIRCSMEHAACAAPMAELLDRVTQMGLENERLFSLTEVALAALNKAPLELTPLISAAHLLKVLAFSGFCPSLSHCVCCGQEVKNPQAAHMVAVSLGEGGVVCSACKAPADMLHIPASTIAWSRTLLGSTFEEILVMDCDMSTSFAVLRFCDQWIQQHVGARLKSLTFLFTSGLF